jgi:hypothetical protein
MKSGGTAEAVPLRPEFVNSLRSLCQLSLRDPRQAGALGYDALVHESGVHKSANPAAR